MTEDAYGRKEGFPTKIVMAVLAAIVIGLWLGVGQGYFSMDLSDTVSPPTIWLTYKGELYSGMRGSYCWAGECIDRSLPEPAGIIDVEQGSTIGFLINTRTEPSFANVSVFMINDSGVPREIGELPEQGNLQFTIDLESGMYVILLHAGWTEIGDVNYAFKINVTQQSTEV